MVTSADEMELYAETCKTFRSVFSRQETMKTFKTYDRVEVRELRSAAVCFCMRPVSGACSLVHCTSVLVPCN